MVKLKRLKIDKFRNVAPGTELHFRDSLNVLLGKNGTGKTTLLNLITAVLSGRFEAFRGEAFRLEYELTVSQVEVTVRLHNRLLESEVSSPDDPFYSAKSIIMRERPPFSASCEVQLQGSSGTGKYLLKVEGARWVLREGAQELWSTGLGGPLLDGPLMSDVILRLRLSGATVGTLREKVPLPVVALGELSSEGLSQLQRFDESLVYLDKCMHSKSLFVGLQMSWGSFRVLTRTSAAPSIGQHLAKALTDDPAVDRLVLRDREAGMGFLAKAVRLLDFASGEVRLQRTARNAGSPGQVEFGDLQFYFARKDGSEIDDSRLSYGQKRLLAFYYYLDCSADCAIADELVNGMHHEWIEACLEDLGERQAFLTSQNPLLLDYLGFESAAEVHSSFVLCSSQLLDGREQLHWENMTPEDSEGFFQAYQVGIQHVSEILRTRGLW